MQMRKLARVVRWTIWGLSAFAVGVMKPVLFPKGGVAYVASALSLLVLCALIGIAIEKWLASVKINRS